MVRIWWDVTTISYGSDLGPVAVANMSTDQNKNQNCGCRRSMELVSWKSILDQSQNSPAVQEERGRKDKSSNRSPFQTGPSLPCHQWTCLYLRYQITIKTINKEIKTITVFGQDIFMEEDIFSLYNIVYRYYASTVASNEDIGHIYLTRVWLKG